MKRVVAAWVLGWSVAGCAEPPAPQPPMAVVPPPAPPPPTPPPPTVEEQSSPLGRDTLGAVLQRAGFSVEDQIALLAALRPVLDMRRMRPSDVVVLQRTDGELTQLVVQRTVDGVPQTVTARRDASAWSAQALTAPVETRREQVAGRVQSTLYETMMAQHELPSLINAFVDAFGSTLDFYRDVQNGDEFRLLVEKRYASEKFLGYGRVLAAEYRQGTRVLHAVGWDGQDGAFAHYDAKGRSTVTAFLRTPMEFTRITSRFGMRFHPVLHAHKAHNGVDYGAPKGTPVWSVGDGKVLSAGYQGACGNAVMVAHPNGIVTGYCHLSRVGAGVRQGVHVGQRQVIGYVGATGRATGPHLHFLMKKRGQFVNPQKIEAPRKPGLRGADLQRFEAALPALLQELSAIPVA